MEWYEVRKLWDWYRYNHFMSRRASLWKVLKAFVGWPLEVLYALVWLRTIGRWKTRQIYKIERELQKRGK